VEIDVRLSVEKVFHVELLANHLRDFNKHRPDLIHLFSSFKVFDVFWLIKVNVVLVFSPIVIPFRNTVIIF